MDIAILLFLLLFGGATVYVFAVLSTIVAVIGLRFVLELTGVTKDGRFAAGRKW
jgi:hypothetical protein